MLDEKLAIVLDAVLLKPVKYIKEIIKNLTTLDFTEREVSITSQPESSQDTQTGSDNHPDINEIADLSIENIIKVFEKLEDEDLTAATIAKLQPYREFMDKNNTSMIRDVIWKDIK